MRGICSSVCLSMTVAAGAACAQVATPPTPDWTEIFESVRTRQETGRTYALTPALTWHEARDYAAAFGLQLASIRDEATLSWLLANMQWPTTLSRGSANDTQVWLGGSDKEREGDWRWPDRSLVQWSNWLSGEPNNAGGIEHFMCLYLTPIERRGRWNDMWDQSPNDPLPFELQALVEWSSDATQTAISTHPHPSWVHEATRHRYTFTPWPGSWRDAERYAQAMGGHLACIETAAEQEWIASTLVFPLFSPPQYPKPYRDVFLGGTNDGQPGRWRWVSGAPFRYTNWSSGNPSNSDSSPMGEPFLTIELSPQHRFGKWNDTASPYFMGRRAFQFGLVEIPLIHDSEKDSFSRLANCGSLARTWDSTDLPSDPAWQHGYLPAAHPPVFRAMRPQEDGSWQATSDPNSARISGHRLTPGSIQALSRRPGGGELPVKRWTSSTEGWIRLCGNLAAAEPSHGGNGFLGSIRVNDVIVWERFIWGHDGRGSDFVLDVSVTPGSTIDFVIDPIRGDAKADTARFLAGLSHTQGPRPPVVPADSLVDEPMRFLEIPIAGELGSDCHADGVDRCLAAAAGRDVHHIVLRLDSRGGSISEGLRMLAVLEKHKASFHYHALVERAQGPSAWLLSLCRHVAVPTSSASTPVLAVGLGNSASSDREYTDAITDIAATVCLLAEHAGNSPGLFEALLRRESVLSVLPKDNIPVEITCNDRVSERALVVDTTRTRFSLWPAEAIAFGVAVPIAAPTPQLLGAAIGVDKWISDGDYGTQLMREHSAARHDLLRSTEQDNQRRAKTGRMVLRFANARERRLHELKEDIGASAAVVRSAVQYAESIDPRTKQWFENSRSPASAADQYKWRTMCDAAVGAWLDVSSSLSTLQRFERRLGELGENGVAHGLDTGELSLRVERELKWFHAHRRYLSPEGLISK